MGGVDALIKHNNDTPVIGIKTKKGINLLIEKEDNNIPKGI